MADEVEIKRLEEELENLRKAKKEIKESSSYDSDIQARILRNLEAQEKFLLEFIKQKREM